MAPLITVWEGLAFFDETVDKASGVPCTDFEVFDEDDTAYFGKLGLPKRDITFRQVTSALAPVSDDVLFPEWT